MKNMFEIMDRVARESHAKKFIDKNAKHLSKENKDKLIAILVKYEKFLQIESGRLEK